jgi:hypothetical protein
LGSCPSQRINNNPNLTGCWEALGENIGILQGNSANLSEIIYNMIYRNKQCCNWSYRNNILKIFANNYGDGQHEGLVGVGIAEGSSYNLPFSPTCAGVYAKILTLNFYDPKAQASCAFFSPLPIVLSQFDAQNLSGNQIQLSWKTEMETSFSHFEIERAGEDEDWQTIEKITGQGSPAQGAHYHFLDVSPSCGSLFYRLKAVDINGEYDYSETQKMELDCNISAAWSVTNPLKDHILHVHFSGKTPDSETPYTITDMQGKIIEKGILQKGATELPLKSLPKGIFLFSLKWDAAPAATMRIINHE